MRTWGESVNPRTDKVAMAKIPDSGLKISLRIVLAGLSAGLLFLSLPEPDQGWLAWIALVPLLIACRGWGLFQSCLIGLFCGLLSNALIFSWILHVPGFRYDHFGIAAFYLALYPAMWCGGLALLGRSKFPALIVAPSLWVFLDFIKAHAGFLALPWASLSYTQHDHLSLLQIMTVTGEYGVTFLLVMANLAVYELFFNHPWRRALAVLILILCVWIWGAFELSRIKSPPNILAAIIQPSILLTERQTASGRLASLQRLEKLTRDAARKNPTFIVWPETALRGFPNDPHQAEQVIKLVMSIRIPLILGTSEYEKFSLPADPGAHTIKLATRSYNSAYLVMPEGTLSIPYRKRLLVPFAEYLPGQPDLNWPQWIVHKSFNTLAGNRPGYVFPEKNLKIALIICWENLFPDFIRPMAGNGIDVIVQLTNDNHFGHSAAPRQHNIASRFRAIENRVPVVVASNTGPSVIFDACGREVALIDRLFSVGTVTGLISRGVSGTSYTRYGDFFAYFCITLSLFWFCFEVLGFRFTPRKNTVDKPDANV